MASEYPNVFEAISSDYYILTTAEKKVADFVLSNQAKTQFMSISDLAGSCGVADATISRFCRRLGYKGFNTFKLAVANATSQHVFSESPLSGAVTQEDTLEEVAKKLSRAEMDAINQTMDLINLDAIKEAVSVLYEARSVMCMGQGGSMLIAHEASHLFSTLSNKFHSVADSHMQAISAALMEPSDVVFYFSYSGATQELMDTLHLVRQQNGKIILVTRFPNSPGAALSDVVLQCGANENALQSGSIAARMAQMYLLDLLFTEYSRRNMEQCLRNRSKIADALADKYV